MCDERILRQNQWIANKLSTEWYEENARYRPIIGEIFDVTRFACRPESAPGAAAARNFQLSAVAVSE
jgi:hypothetical protein